MKTSIYFLLLCSSTFICACESNEGKAPETNQLDTINVTPGSSQTIAQFVYGIDISKYQGDEVAFLDKQKDSLSFIICKATEGITYTPLAWKNKGWYFWQKTSSYKVDGTTNDFDVFNGGKEDLNHFIENN